MNKILSAATRLATISATAKLPSWLLGMSPAHQKAYLKEHPDSPFANLMGGAKVAPVTAPVDTGDAIPSTYKAPKTAVTPIRVNGDVGKGYAFLEKITNLGFGTQVKPITKTILDRLLKTSDITLDIKTKSNGKFVTANFIARINGKWYWLDTSVEEQYYMIKQGAKVDSLVEALTIQLPEPLHTPPMPTSVKPVGGTMSTRQVPNNKSANTKMGKGEATAEHLTIGHMMDAENNLLAALVKQKLVAKTPNAKTEIGNALKYLCSSMKQGRALCAGMANGDDSAVANFIGTYFSTEDTAIHIKGKDFFLIENKVRQDLEAELVSLQAKHAAILKRGKGKLSMTQADQIETIDAQMAAIKKRLKMKVVSSADLGGLSIKTSKQGGKPSLTLVFGKNESIDLGTIATIQTLNPKRMADTLSQQVKDAYDEAMDDLVAEMVGDVEADNEENESDMTDSQIQREAEKRATASSLKDPEIQLMRKLMNDKSFLSEAAQAIIDKASSSK